MYAFDYNKNTMKKQKQTSLIESVLHEVFILQQMIEKLHLQVLLKSMACVDKRLTSIPAATVQLHDPSYKHVYSPQV